MCCPFHNVVLGGIISTFRFASIFVFWNKISPTCAAFREKSLCVFSPQTESQEGYNKELHSMKRTMHISKFFQTSVAVDAKMSDLPLMNRATKHPQKRTQLTETGETLVQWRHTSCCHLTPCRLTFPCLPISNVHIAFSWSTASKKDMCASTEHF